VSSLSYQRGSWAGGVLLGNTYLLGRRINGGGMGEVFEATHARLPGRYAVKILRPDLVGNREAFARFCREAEVMSELRHPNIVQIYDFNTTPDGRPYFVMEHLDGRDLEARLAESGPLPLPAAVRVVEAVASALATAHAHGIVHRDLKPANIFLVTIDGQIDEQVKVLDFGISKLRASGTLLSSPTDMLGSPAYMSPEQARGASDEVDGRSDQFALGAITYRMLTGWDPFAGDDIASLLYQVVHQEAPPLARSLPPFWDTRALQAVLDRALAKDPAQRYSGMMEMARAFEAASEQTLSHEAASQGTVDLGATNLGATNLGATLIATPPPPPLRPARQPAPAELEIEEGAPPVRTPPPELSPALPELRPPLPQQRGSLDFDVAAPTAPRPTGRRESVREEAYGDQLPVTHHRWALAGLALLAVAGLFGMTGLYHRIIPTARRELGLGHRAPAVAPAPSPETASPPADRAVPPVSAPSLPHPTAAAPPAAPEPAARPPAKPKPIATEAHPAAELHSHRHHMDAGPRLVARPGSVYLAPSKSLAPSELREPSEPRDMSRPPAPPRARPNPFAQPPGTPPPTMVPDSVPDQFTIPPPAPTSDSPARDLAPPAEPEREPSPGRAVTPPPPPPPRTQNPSDQPMPPSF
jgi:serine/threonine-protein kinase